MAEQESVSWWLQGAVVVVMVLLGAVCMGVYDKTKTANAFSNMNAQLERLQTPPAVAAIVPTKKSKKQRGVGI